MNNSTLPTFQKLNYTAQHLKPTHKLIIGSAPLSVLCLKTTPNRVNAHVCLMGVSSIKGRQLMYGQVL